MKKLEKLTLKELSNEMSILDSKSCGKIQGGIDPQPPFTFDLDRFLNDFYGNSTIRQLCGVAEDLIDGAKDLVKDALTSFSEDQINNMIDRVTTSPFNYLQYMPAPPDWGTSPLGSSSNYVMYDSDSKFDMSAEWEHDTDFYHYDSAAGRWVNN